MYWFCSVRTRELADYSDRLLEEPTRPMIQEAKAASQYHHEDMGKSYDRISIVTIQEIIEGHRRLEIPMSMDVLKAAQKELQGEQLKLL